MRHSRTFLKIIPLLYYAVCILSMHNMKKILLCFLREIKTGEIPQMRDKSAVCVVKRLQNLVQNVHMGFGIEIML